MSLQIEVPVVNIEVKPGSTLFVPTTEDYNSGINDALTKAMAAPGFAQVSLPGNHRLLPIESVSPHTNGLRHTVFWVDDRSNEPHLVDWEDDSWIHVARDGDFLASAQEYFRDLQQEDPNLRVYFFIGFANGNRPDLDGFTHIFPSGLQSQYRAHIHAVSAPNLDGTQRTLDPQTYKSDEKQLIFLANEGGERAIQDHEEALQGYGSRFTYSQRIGRRGADITRERTMFGFHSLQEALVQSLLLQERVRADWINYVKGLAGEMHEFAGLMLPIMQSCVPNVAIIIPSENDRINGGVENNFPVWTMPFAIGGTQGVLTPGGVAIDRPR